MIDRSELEQRVQALKPMSETARSLLALVSRDHALADVVEVIERDASLTLRTLAVANSTLFATACDIDTVSRAAGFLGERTILALAMNGGAKDLLAKELAGYRSASGTLWTSGLRTAIASQQIARRATVPIDGALAYTGAILRDIGKVVASDLLNDAGGVDGLVDQREASDDFCSIERQSVGFDHCQVGAMVCDHFGLPAVLGEVAHHHHDPCGASEEAWPIVACVHVADAISMMAASEQSIDNMAYRLAPEAVDFLGLEGGGFEEVICETTAEFQQVSDAIGAG
jgi:HD-like signal output (HDOD) protein